MYVHVLITDFKKEDLLTPDITVTEKEKQNIQNDITVVNTRKDRIEMALKDVLEEYSVTCIDVT